MFIYCQAFNIRLRAVALPWLTCLCLGPILFPVTNLVSLDAKRECQISFALLSVFLSLIFSFS